jgi:hypothetical protein
VGMETNLDLTEESSVDWLPKCDEPVVAWLIPTGESRFFYAYCSPVVKDRLHRSSIHYQLTTWYKYKKIKRWTVWRIIDKIFF